MDLSIVIVSWNTRELLKKCLKSIYDSNGSISFEIFVIDNNSADGSAKMVRADFPEVKLIEPGENLGFSKANNIGIKQAIGEYVLLLNPDTEVFADTLSKSLNFMKHHTDAGAMGCQMIYPDGREQASVRRLPTVWPILLLLFKVPKIFPNLSAIKKYLAEDFDYSKTQTVEQIMGAYMMIPRSVLDRIGLLDERFFAWFEEVDLCRRISLAGHKIYYYPDTKIIHHGGKSFAQQKVVTNQRVFFTSAFKYFIKYLRKQKSSV